VQAQDERGFRLAVRARTRGLTAADVDRALAEGALVVTWLNRGTLHLVRAEDYAWLHALTAPRQLAGIERRLRQEGVESPERGLEAIEEALAGEGPLAREQLRERIDRIGVRTEGQALILLLALASSRGLIVRGPVVDGEHAYALVGDWLGEPPVLDREAALAELARRYLAGHGPATDRDLARWSGLPLRDARAGLSAIAGSLQERDDGLLDLAGREPPPEAGPPTRLLGPFDPVLLGWSSREWLLGEHDSRVVSGGIFRAFALADGRAVATWRLRRGEVELEPFGGLRASALDEEATDVTRFLGANQALAPRADGVHGSRNRTGGMGNDQRGS
jgi:uncharacterized protein YcaQ